MAYCVNGGGWGAANCGSSGNGCCNNNGGNNGCSAPNCGNGCAGATCAAYDNCGGSSCNSGFSCVVNLIIILIVLQFLTQIISGLNCE